MQFSTVNLTIKGSSAPDIRAGGAACRLLFCADAA
jgi:hypothetical protein